jgi:hypothetical protein
MCIHKTKLFFLVVRNELLFPQKTHFTEEGDITFSQWLVTCINNDLDEPTFSIIYNQHPTPET